MSFINNKQSIDKPVEHFLDWKGKGSDGYFSYWDSESDENVKYEIGKCSIVGIGFIIKGFNENMNTSIYSNKIFNFRDDEVVVKSKGDVLARGIWSDIKDQVSSIGGKLYKAVTLYDSTNDKLIEVNLKGQAGWGIQDKETKKLTWGGFTPIEKAMQKAMDVDKGVFGKIEFSGPKLIEGSAFAYNLPEFKVLEGEVLSEKEAEIYIEKCNLLDTYEKAVSDKNNEEITVAQTEEVKSVGFEDPAADEEISVDSIPF